MDGLHLFWAFVVQHKVEIEFAAIFAFVFGIILTVIFEIMSFGSRLRAWVRHIKNKLSERSVSKLRKRIKQLEVAKEQYQTYLGSDKALYLMNLKIVFIVLIGMCLSGVLILIAHGQLVIGRSTVQIGETKTWAFWMLIFCITVAAGGIKFASLDSREKVSAIIAKYDSEIAGLKSKLELLRNKSA
jgi:hypothetical protein